ncbi:MAG TPA: hypothetical protein PLW97_07770 [Synergistaceae bacterium]|nr:hypothetical protein [Synergistaceae bacterium]HPQ37524.1 hypothetical protein [Synergistaceae bacterium]
MHFTLMETNEKRYVMFDNHTGKTFYDPDLLARSAQTFHSQYSCMEARGFLVLSPPKDENTDFSAAFYSCKGCREKIRLDEAICALEFARSLGIPFNAGSFSSGDLRIHYGKDGLPEKTGLRFSENLPNPLSPSFFRYGTENLCYYTVHVPGPHGVIILEYPGIFHSSELLFLAKILVNDPLRFPQGGDISFIESSQEDRLKILTYVHEENRLIRSSSEGALACAMVHHNLHPETETLCVESSPEDKLLCFSLEPDSSFFSFFSSASCISKGTVLGKNVF